MLHPGTLILLVLSAAGGAAGAQARPSASTPFGTAGLSAGIAADVQRSASLAGWSPSVGVELRVLFPFHAGSVELGASQVSYDARIAGLPSFRARHAFFGWGAGIPVLRRLAWRTGVRLGVYDLQFDDETLPDYAQSENEVATELMTELGLDLGRGWSVIGGAGGRLVFTEPRMRQLTLSGSLRRTFVSPEWLRDFLD
jgi:hypothetical protein